MKFFPYLVDFHRSTLSSLSLAHTYGGFAEQPDRESSSHTNSVCSKVSSHICPKTKPNPFVRISLICIVFLIYPVSQTSRIPSPFVFFGCNRVVTLEVNGMWMILLALDFPEHGTEEKSRQVFYLVLV